MIKDRVNVPWVAGTDITRAERNVSNAKSTARDAPIVLCVLRVVRDTMERIVKTHVHLAARTKTATEN